MPRKDVVCPKCNSTMEPGMLAGLQRVMFVKKMTANVIRKRPAPLTAYKCPKCSYCELYAGDEPSDSNTR